MALDPSVGGELLGAEKAVKRALVMMERGDDARRGMGAMAVLCMILR